MLKVTQTTGAQQTVPVAQPDSATAVSGQATGIDVLANDTDPDNLLVASTVSIVTQPAHGTANPNANGSGQVVYTSAAGYTGTDSFVYQVCGVDETLCTSATVTDDGHRRPGGGDHRRLHRLSRPHHRITAQPRTVGGGPRGPLRRVRAHAPARVGPAPAACETCPLSDIDPDLEPDDRAIRRLRAAGPSRAGPTWTVEPIEPSGERPSSVPRRRRWSSRRSSS